MVVVREVDGGSISLPSVDPMRLHCPYVGRVTPERALEATLAASLKGKVVKPRKRDRFGRNNGLEVLAVALYSFQQLDTAVNVAAGEQADSDTTSDKAERRDLGFFYHI